ncbi:MAG TPA: VOC family protein, partial [Flavisolibacter sp.]|nr:VOC family protein [Flavisolibacter sp.]
MEDFIKLSSMANVQLPEYIIPAATRIGHIHLKVTDLQRALGFYKELLGFEVMQWYGDSAVF